MLKNKPNPGFGIMFEKDSDGNPKAPAFTGEIALTDELIDVFKKDGSLSIAAWERETSNGKLFLSLSLSKVFKPKDDKKKRNRKLIDDDFDL